MSLRAIAGWLFVALGALELLFMVFSGLGLGVEVLDLASGASSGRGSASGGIGEVIGGGIGLMYVFFVGTVHLVLGFLTVRKPQSNPTLIAAVASTPLSLCLCLCAVPALLAAVFGIVALVADNGDGHPE